MKNPCLLMDFDLLLNYPVDTHLIFTKGHKAWLKCLNTRFTKIIITYKYARGQRCCLQGTQSYIDADCVIL